MKVIKTILAAATAFLILSCGDNSSNFESVAGQYWGVLPCADCDGVETLITLSSAGEYSVVSQYIGVGKELVDTMEGRYRIKEDLIELLDIEKGSASPHYKVEGDNLRHLDLSGNVIEGKLENFYILRKVGNPMVEGKRWQLTHIYGKEIEESNPETHYIIFHADEGRAEARANCNYLSIPYRITNQFRVKFNDGISTLMACPDDLEPKFLEVLSEVDNLSVSENSLTLNRARMAPLAIFKLVE